MRHVDCRCQGKEEFSLAKQEEGVLAVAWISLLSHRHGMCCWIFLFAQRLIPVDRQGAIL